MKKNIWNNKTIVWMVLLSFFINFYPTGSIGNIGQAKHAVAASDTLEYQPPREQCKTTIPGESGATGNFCYTMSEGGKLIQRWAYRFKDDNWMIANKIKFEYVGMQDVGTSSNGALMTKWVYQEIWAHSYLEDKDVTDTNRYITVGYSGADFGGLDTLIISHDWDPEKKQWIMRLGDGSTEPRINNVIWESKKYGLPDYKNKDNSQRVVVSGRASYKADAAASSQVIEGKASLFFNDKNGPPLDTKDINKDDGSFEFSYSGANSDIWVNRAKVKKIFLYIKGDVVDATDKKIYEKFIELDTESDFDWQDNDASTNVIVMKKAEGRNVVLTPSENVAAPSRDDNAPVNPIVETGGGACGDSGIFNITGAILVGLCNMSLMIHDWALSLMCFAQDKLVDEISEAPMKPSQGCGANDVLQGYQNEQNVKNLMK